MTSLDQQVVKIERVGSVHTFVHTFLKTCGRNGPPYFDRVS
jgi:hypothetical protein